MSPTVFRFKNFRFYFFSREETRMHVHVSCPEGEAKFWIEPMVALAQHQDISPKTLKTIHKIIEDRKNEIVKAWKKHFGN